MAKTIATAATIQEILEVITSHPVGYLVEIRKEMFMGAYPHQYPAKLAVEGSNWTFATSMALGAKPVRTVQGVKEFLDDLATSSSATGWAENILRQNSWHTDPFLSSSSEDEQRFISAEKLFFSNPHGGKTFCSFVLGDYRVTPRFHVTSGSLDVAVRASFCPEAAGQKPGPHQASDRWLSIGTFSFGENGAGFNKKYEDAIAILKRFIAGDWEGLAPHYQHNRSSSISAQTGETNTRFWSAQLTFPDKAYEKSSFPLFTSRLVFP